MSTQITGPVVENDDAQRRGHLAALSAATLIVMHSPVVPNDITVRCNDFAPDSPQISVFFYESAAGVEQLAQSLGAQATTRPFRDTDPRPYVSMTATLDGIPVEAWTLLGKAEVAA
ncbi:hypothetical protein [Streptomyces sp. NPDC093097]|uniref:hypothetical protein n=1 Tax=Streptomyces sp. NPDC093097 TaxID=3366027 RepID=UPI00381D83AF